LPVDRKRFLITDLEVTAIGLTKPPTAHDGKQPATGYGIILRTADGGDREIQTDPIVTCKLDKMRQMVYSVVYSPGRWDSQNQGVAKEDAQVISKAAHNFISNGFARNIDILHDRNTNIGARVVESWVTKKEGDPFFNPPEVPVGSWAVGIKIDSDDLWGKILAGEYGGISLFGLSQVREYDGGKTMEKTDSKQTDTVQVAKSADVEPNTVLQSLAKLVSKILGKEQTDGRVEKTAENQTQENKEVSNVDETQYKELVDGLNKLTEKIAGIEAAIEETKKSLTAKCAEIDSVAQEAKKTAEDVTPRVEALEGRRQDTSKTSERDIKQPEKADHGLFSNLIPAEYRPS